MVGRQPDERNGLPDVTDYDSFAQAYAAENESNLFNAHYERPEMLRLAGDVAGRRILDAGCGSGPLTAALRDAGAVVTGLDASTAMGTLTCFASLGSTMAGWHCTAALKSWLSLAEARAAIFPPQQ